MDALPPFYAAPLFVLAASAIAGLSFMVALIVNYEEVQHGNPHTRKAARFDRNMWLQRAAAVCHRLLLVDFCCYALTWGPSCLESRVDSRWFQGGCVASMRWDILVTCGMKS